MRRSRGRTRVTPAETLWAAIAHLADDVLVEQYRIREPRAPSRIGEIRLTVPYADLVTVLSGHPMQPPGDIHPFVIDAVLDLPAVQHPAGGPPPIQPGAPPEPGGDLRLLLRIPLPASGA